jgi:adenine-specific DNA methylase
VNFRESETAQKLAGSYYTPKPIADFLSKWISEVAPKRVLEPSCGDGVLLGSLVKQYPNVEQLVAVDIDKDALAAVAEKCALGELPSAGTSLIEGDFLTYGFEALAGGKQFDAVIGNPPFIRYQYLEKPYQQQTERVFGELGLRFTKHTNAWVPFVLQALRLLRPGGRLGMVVPAELMHVLHANSLREYLLDECDRIAVVHLEELFDESVLQGVVLLLCSKKEQASTGRADIAFPQARGEDLVNGHAAAFLKTMPFTSGKTISYKWMEGLLTDAEAEAYNAAKSLVGVHRFSALADVDVGIVTGANSFFLVSDETVDEYGLAEFAEPMFGRSSHVRGVRIGTTDLVENRANGLPANFIRLPAVPKEALPAGVRSYVEMGERQKLHTRYKCRIRNPWYVVPSVWSAEVAMLKRAHDMPRLLLNDAQALSTDTAYRIKMRPEHSAKATRLVWCFVNSLTALSAELEGRHYGGGVIELVPSEIERVLVPFAPGGRQQLERLDALFRAGTPISEILVAQDEQTLKAVGLSDEHRRVIHAAWQRLRRRRQRAEAEA